MTKFHEDTEAIALNRASDSDSPNKDRFSMNRETISSWRYHRFWSSILCFATGTVGSGRFRLLSVSRYVRLAPT